MKKFMLEEAEALVNAEMAVVKGGALSGCSSCCDDKNGGGSTHFEKHDKEEDEAEMR